MPIFDSAAIYIQSCTTGKAQIAAVDAVIAALTTTMLTAATNGELYEEYELDDGQTKIKCRYRSVSAIMASINGLRAYRNQLERNVNGSIIRLMDQSNFL